ncbi:MAG: cupredoxin domain-containing protein [Acidimicrobiales bacterium]
MLGIRRRTVLGGAVLALVFAAAGCGSDGPGGVPAGCTPIVGGETTLVARNLAWNTHCLRVPPGTKVTFTVRLEDEGVKHDLEVNGPSGRAKTDLETGPTTQTLTFTFDEPGRHRFVCTIHSRMEGDLFVEA